VADPRESDDLTVPPGVRIGAVLVQIEALGFVVAAVAVLVLSVIHETTRLWAAFAIAFFALGAAALCWFGARGLRKLQPAFRSPIMLVQLLAIPVAISLLQAGRWLIGVPILAIAVVVLFELFRPASREALDRVV